MYITVSGRGDAKVIQMVEQHRIPNTNKKRTKVIKTFGNYKKMLAENPNVIEELKAYAKEKTAEKREGKRPLTLKILRKNIKQNGESLQSLKFGHCVIQRIWKDLDLDKFFKKNIKHRYPKKVQEAIFALVSHRMMNPASIQATYNDLENYLGIQRHHKDLYYRTLDILNEISDALIDHLCRQFEEKTERMGPVAYYDVTTFSFESVDQGELRMFGYSKDHKHHEVQVVLGLLMDNQGIPISYQLFPGNTMDQKTLRTAVENLKERYQMDKIVIVADRGLNGKDNLNFLSESNHDFVISYTLKTAPDKIKYEALSLDGWENFRYDDNGELIYRSKVIPHTYEIKVEMTEEEKNAQPKKRGRPRKYKTIKLPVNIHITWEASRAIKDAKDRQRMVEKAEHLIEDPSKLKASVKRGRNQYINFEVDNSNPTLNEEQIERQSQYDGLYAIVTNQLCYDTHEVSGHYGGLWQIEESFKVMKSDLKARPVFVWTDPHVRGHFVLCFLGLCLMRYLQYICRINQGLNVSCAVLSEVLESARVTVFKETHRLSLMPTDITADYLILMKAAQLPDLLTIMTPTEFKRKTQLTLLDDQIK